VKKWNLVVDVERCNNCNNCFLAVKDEHGGNDFPGYAAPQPAQGARWLRVERQERGVAPMIDVSHYPVACNHCDNAPCMNAETAGVITKRADGIVLIDPVAAKGRKDIVGMCPYGHIHWNEELKLPQNWIFEAHLLDQGWKEPRVSQVCPTGAIEAVKVEDAAMKKRAARDKLRTLRPELGAKPRIYYRNFNRVDKVFLGGSLAEMRAGVEECAEGVELELWLNGKLLQTTKTDAFGDFKFDGLEPGAGDYEVRLVKGRKAAGLPIKLSLPRSEYIGLRMLD
jgi:Fe-S-cluster-containing dehydrogenase component